HPLALTAPKRTSADILVRPGLANVVEADKNVRAPIVFSNRILAPSTETVSYAQLTSHPQAT
ncbi:MAG: hypothetical protein WCK27_27005, partial [Verrucomicrobiota bacterium]